VRTCVGCREAAPQAALARFAWTGERVVRSRTAPGRGAWVHPLAPTCLEQALKRRAFDRAFRRSIPASALDLLRQEQVGGG
jgi:predicted RNA-binding protein YlxR (DUF448 family)